MTRTARGSLYSGRGAWHRFVARTAAGASGLPAPAQRFAGHVAVEQDDIATAARLVLAPRALIFPQAQEPEPPGQPPESPAENEADNDGHEEKTPDIDRALDEVILAAVQAAIPPDILAAMRAGSMGRRTQPLLRQRRVRCKNPTNAAVPTVCCVASCARAPSSM